MDWVSRVFESSAKGYALSMGEKKNEDGTAQQHGSTGEMHGGWSKPDLVAWARKLGIDKISTHI